MPASTRHANRPVTFTLAALTLTALAVVAFVIRDSRDTPAATPEGTVRAMLIWSVANHNGFEACRYLTRRAVLEAQARGAGQDDDCQTMFDNATLRLGHVQVHLEAQLKRLTYRVWRDDRHAVVTVSGDGGSK